MTKIAKTLKICKNNRKQQKYQREIHRVSVPWKKLANSKSFQKKSFEENLHHFKKLKKNQKKFDKNQKKLEKRGKFTLRHQNCKFFIEISFNIFPSNSIQKSSIKKSL